MDEASWPTDNRLPKKKVRLAKGKGKDKTKEFIRDYPSLEHGSLNALTLAPGTGGLKWAAITHTSEGKKLEGRGDAQKLFPATRPYPMRIPTTSVSQRAEQGANFLRTHFPDIEIPAELIRDEIHADTRILHGLEKYDPYAGNLLEALQCQVGLVSQTTFLCFPMGESNQNLNMSPFELSQTADMVFKPVAFPSQTFQTPIKQIVSSSSENRKQASYLAIRTLASTSLLEAKGISNESTPEVQLIERAIIESSDTGGRPIVDIKLASSPTVGIIVNDHGAVYKCDFGSGWKSLSQLHASQMNTESPDDFFWKLSLIDHGDGCILASDKHLTRLDWRTSDNTLDLFSLQRRGDVLTSVEGPQMDNLIRLCSTTEVLWIDGRFTRSPLLAYKHGRSFDRTLETRTVFLPTPQTFLTSRKNGLITIYDVSRLDDGLIHSNVPSYSVPPVSGYDTRNVGHLLFRHPSNPSKTATTMYQLSERGSIHCLDLDFPPVSQIMRECERCDWSPDVQSLEEAANVYPDMGPLASQIACEVDLHLAYQKIFNVNRDARAVLDEHSRSVKEASEKMASFWLDPGSPGRMLTKFDVAFCSSKDPLEFSRADFLTQSDINCKEGYRTLIQGRIPSQPIVHDAPWHYDLTPVLRNLDLDIPKDPQALVDHLRQYDLASETATSSRIQSDACEQLALDLALSTDVLSARPFVCPMNDNLDALETMSRATEAMSLVDEPPPVQLGYLRPKPTTVTSGRSSAQSRTASPASQEFDCPMGVRLLLKEWEVGTDPRGYTYEDPYDESNGDFIPIRRPRDIESSTQPTQTIKPTQSQRPPLVVASKSLLLPMSTAVDVPTHQRLGIHSQGSTNKAPLFRTGSQTTTNDPGIGTFSQSQDFMTSTQILPGPYGGRQPIKKKPVKKRLGGF